MPAHANFAAAIAIRQGTLEDLVRVLHHNNLLPHQLAIAAGVINADLFLEMPEIVCSSANGNRLVLNLRAWGPVTITLADQPPERREVLFTARVLASPRISLQNASMRFSVQADSATLDTFDISVLSGGPFSPMVQFFLGHPLLRLLLEAALRDRLATMQDLTPPINVAFLGDIANASNTTLTPRVVDGALAIGLDLNGGGVQTAGDPNLLTNITPGYDIAIWLNPAALPAAMERVYAQVSAQAEGAGATLDSFSLTVQEGRFHGAGQASRSEGTATFSFDAVPRLIRPGVHMEWEEEYGEHFEFDTPPREELWFEMQNVNVDMDRAWWVVLLEGVLGPFAISIVEVFVNSIRNTIVGGIGSTSNQSMASRTQEFTFPNTSEPTVRLKLQEYACHPEGVFTGITLRPQFLKPLMQGDRNCFIELAAIHPPRFSVRLPFDAHPADPALRIRWTVRRRDTNQISLQFESQAGSAREITLAAMVQAMLETSEFLVECRVYRVLGATATDLYNASKKLSIVDNLDRSHPYVRWRHWVLPPIVQVEADGSRTRTGFVLTNRTSRIHRTAFPGRCRMAAAYSIRSPEPARTPFGHFVPDPLLPLPEMEYLDALPFSTTDLAAHRAQLCDYCFFGGPTKTVPLIP